MSFIFFFLIFIKFYFVFSTYFNLNEKEINNDIIKLTIFDRNNSVYIFTQSNFYIIKQNDVSNFKINFLVEDKTSAGLFLENFIILVCEKNNFLIILSKEKGEILFTINYNNIFSDINNSSGNVNYDLNQNYKCSLDINNEEIIIGFNQYNNSDIIYHNIILNITKDNNDNKNFTINLKKFLNFSKKYNVNILENNPNLNNLINIHCFIVPKKFCIYQNNNSLFYYLINNELNHIFNEKEAITSNSTNFYIQKIERISNNEFYCLCNSENEIIH